MLLAARVIRNGQPLCEYAALNDVVITKSAMSRIIDLSVSVDGRYATARLDVTLTNAWAPYSIDLSGQSYTQVLGGFGWTMAATDAGATGAFFVDDMLY